MLYTNDVRAWCVHVFLLDYPIGLLQFYSKGELYDVVMSLLRKEHTSVFMFSVRHFGPLAGVRKAGALLVHGVKEERNIL